MKLMWYSLFYIRFLSLSLPPLSISLPSLLSLPLPPSPSLSLLSLYLSLSLLYATLLSQVYTFVVGKLSPAKLANFSDVDVFVLISCPEHSLVYCIVSILIFIRIFWCFFL